MFRWQYQYQLDQKKRNSMITVQCHVRVGTATLIMRLISTWSANFLVYWLTNNAWSKRNIINSDFILLARLRKVRSDHHLEVLRTVQRHRGTLPLHALVTESTPDQFRAVSGSQQDLQAAHRPAKHVVEKSELAVRVRGCHGRAF